jgi:outer membrane lipoprotein-sorting protein
MRGCKAIFLAAGLAFGQMADDALLEKIWAGVQEAQNKTQSSCGRITETRTSALLAKPKIFRGEFCAEGLTKFALEYKEPERVKLVFNTDYLNVTTGPKTEVMQVGQNVRRTQNYFSRENSITNLKKEFTVTAREDGAVYELKMIPRSSRFASRINHVIVRLAKADFTLRSLEVDGKSGVRSVFDIVLTSRNTKLDPKLFDVYKPVQ